MRTMKELIIEFNHELYAKLRNVFIQHDETKLIALVNPNDDETYNFIITIIESFDNLEKEYQLYELLDIICRDNRQCLIKYRNIKDISILPDIHQLDYEDTYITIEPVFDILKLDDIHVM